jgi:predicted RNA-binding protein with PIN domain
MPRHLIIDGYNLLRSSPRFSAEVEHDLESACTSLIADLGARAADGQRVTVVFDGAGNPFSDGQPRNIGEVTVIYSPSGTDADSVIESLASSARETGEETEIVTSDVATRWTSLGGAVIVTRSTSFARELEADDADRRAHRDAEARKRGTVSDRLDPEVRTRLDVLSGRRKPPVS